jgi:hypothetical protein
MRLIVLAVAFAALAAPAWAGPPERHSYARLLDCEVDARTAVFRAEIRKFKAAVGLSLRFTLQSRDEEDSGWRRVAAPGFGEWLRAKPGSTGFIYDKALENLVPGADYRVVVRFRWRDATGGVVARAVKRSRPCRVPAPRANLVPESLTVLPGSTDSTRTYSLVVANRGETTADEFFVRVADSDDVVLHDSTSADLPPESTVEVRFEAQACVPGSQLTATVDTEAEVDETSETDNVISVACPPAGAGKQPGAF